MASPHAGHVIWENTLYTFPLCFFHGSRSAGILPSVTSLLKKLHSLDGGANLFHRLYPPKNGRAPSLLGSTWWNNQYDLWMPTGEWGGANKSRSSKQRSMLWHCVNETSSSLPHVRWYFRRNWFVAPHYLPDGLRRSLWLRHRVLCWKVDAWSFLTCSGFHHRQPCHYLSRISFISFETLCRKLLKEYVEQIDRR